MLVFRESTLLSTHLSPGLRPNMDDQLVNREAIDLVPGFSRFFFIAASQGTTENFQVPGEVFMQKRIVWKLSSVKKTRQCWISNLQGNLQRRVRMKHPLDAGALIEASHQWMVPIHIPYVKTNKHESGCHHVSSFPVVVQNICIIF